MRNLWLLLSRFKAVVINCPPAMRDRQCFSLGVNAVRVSSFGEIFVFLEQKL